MPPRPPQKGMNLNTLILILTAIGGLVTVGKVLLPLAVVPEKVEQVGQSVSAVRRDVDDVAKVQAVQTEALKRLADIASDANATRRDVDRHGAEIKEVQRRLDRIEAR